MSAETLIDRLDKVKATAPGRWLALCPAHDDNGPSLSVREVDDRVLIHCFAGCGAADVMAAVGLELHDLLLEKPCTKCAQMFAPMSPDHDRCDGCFRGDPSTRQYRKPAHRRIPATDALHAIDHEAHVVAIIGADIIHNKTIDADTWNRLSTSVSRIGAARAMTCPARIK